MVTMQRGVRVEVGFFLEVGFAYAKTPWQVRAGIEFQGSDSAKQCEKRLERPDANPRTPVAELLGFILRDVGRYQFEVGEEV